MRRYIDPETGRARSVTDSIDEAILREAEAMVGTSTRNAPGAVKWMADYIRRTRETYRLEHQRSSS